MVARNINVFITSFGGLGLPPTVNLVRSDELSTQELQAQIYDILPPLDGRIIITTISSKQVYPSAAPISTLLPAEQESLLQLRLSVPLCGGKGGFGSQLRAAGGRMSSKRKKNQGENNNSNRNLDGRRLRTVNEAKALAEYLALKPDMEKKEKDARRQRWEQVVKRAEEREEEIRNNAKGKVDGKWVEDKEEAGERTREAVLAAIKAGGYRDTLQKPREVTILESPGQICESSGEDSQTAPDVCAGSHIPRLSVVAPRSYLGFDDDDEYMSGSDDDSIKYGDGALLQGKGKGRD